MTSDGSVRVGTIAHKDSQRISEDVMAADYFSCHSSTYGLWTYVYVR